RSNTSVSGRVRPPGSPIGSGSAPPESRLHDDRGPGERDVHAASLSFTHVALRAPQTLPGSGTLVIGSGSPVRRRSRAGRVRVSAHTGPRFAKKSDCSVALV